MRRLVLQLQGELLHLIDSGLLRHLAVGRTATEATSAADAAALSNIEMSLIDTLAGSRRTALEEGGRIESMEA